MIGLTKLFLKLFPWLLCVGLLSYLLISEKLGIKKAFQSTEIHQNTLLQSVEKIGKLEVVQYNLQQITELKKVPGYIDLKLFQLKNPLIEDAKGVLISQGSATGCIDLTKVSKSDILLIEDTLYITLPQPELCNFKIDLEKSRLYDLEIRSILDQQKEFMEELYRLAEADVKKSAMDMGIIEQSRSNAILILKPLFENVSGMPVIINFDMATRLESVESQ
ncbi:DUF4230 domain-containing protein [Marinoscillum sp. MHG1-6]|uniref:DUF4230 domain-containing protein n=1 Tax=Marinoscillum sp. MHG1-6 TaxID=2959627 RepID=UPI0021573F95|nr:DUF4230 domain-containing protein [Marinoscillum sp. MHG1-6]